MRALVYNIRDLPAANQYVYQFPLRLSVSDLHPRTSPPSKLDLGPCEVHPRGSNPVLATAVTWCALDPIWTQSGESREHTPLMSISYPSTIH